MNSSEIFQIIGIVLGSNAIFFCIFFFATRLKNPTIYENKKRLHLIEVEQARINSKLIEIINCIENLSSSMIAGLGNTQYVLKNYILNNVDSKKEKELIRRLGSSALNTKRASLELRLLYKKGPDLISAAQQLVERIGDVHTIEKFETAVNTLSDNKETHKILSKYLDRLKKRLNADIKK